MSCESSKKKIKVEAKRCQKSILVRPEQKLWTLRNRQFIGFECGNLKEKGVQRAAEIKQERSHRKAQSRRTRRRREEEEARAFILVLIQFDSVWTLFLFFRQMDRHKRGPLSSVLSRLEHDRLIVTSIC